MKLILTARPDNVTQYVESSSSSLNMTKVKLCGFISGGVKPQTINGRTAAIGSFASIEIDAGLTEDTNFRITKRYRVTIEELPDEQ